MISFGNYEDQVLEVMACTLNLHSVLLDGPILREAPTWLKWTDRWTRSLWHLALCTIYHSILLKLYFKEHNVHCLHTGTYPNRTTASPLLCQHMPWFLTLHL